jgi:long-chain acyl-CoA synthetase
MLYNNQNPYTTLFLVPSKEDIQLYVKEKGIQLDSNEAAEKALSLIESEVREYRTGGKFGEMFPQRWMPAAIGIIDEPFSMDNELVNSLGKMVRGKVVDRYQQLLEFLYTPEAKVIINDHNLTSIRKILGG